MTVWYLPHFILSATCLPVKRRQNALWGSCMTTWTYWSTMTVMASCMNIRPLMIWNQTFVEIINNDHQSSQQSRKHQENENAPDFLNVLLTIPDSWGSLQFQVFISQKHWDDCKTVKLLIIWDFGNIQWYEDQA